MVEDPQIATSPAKVWPTWWPSLRKGLLVLCFFHLTCLGWLLFRAGSLPAGVNQLEFVLKCLATMFVVPERIDPLAQTVLVLGLASLFFQWRFDAMNRFSKWPVFWQTVGVISALCAIAALGVFEGAQFIYFQF